MTRPLERVGNHTWAMARARAGKLVRRKSWPVELVKAGTVFQQGDGAGPDVVREDFVKVWHVRADDDHDLIKGWGGQIGADNSELGPGGADGTLYSPPDGYDWGTDWEIYNPAHPPLPNCTYDGTRPRSGWGDDPRKPYRNRLPITMAVVVMLGILALAYIYNPALP